MSRSAGVVAILLSVSACGVAGMPRPPNNSVLQARPVAGDPSMLPSLPPGNAPAAQNMGLQMPAAPFDGGVAVTPESSDAGRATP